MLRIICITAFVMCSVLAFGQEKTAMPKYGDKDTMLVPAIFYDGEWMPYAQMDVLYVSNMSAQKLAKYIQDAERLRRAVYATYAYAVNASRIINDVNTHLQSLNSKKERKQYIKSREAELRNQFADPVSNLSVYQGKVMMKLIYRETGSDCYDIIREYRGGMNARMFQTAYFFFGGDFKQGYDITHDATDKQIESVVQEIYTSWYARAAPPPVVK